MEPLPETREALGDLSMTSQVDLMRVISSYADRVVAALPACVGLSVTLREDELTFTWLTTSDHLRGLEAAQFLDGGPCEVAAHTGEGAAVSDLLDEDQWRLLGLASAAIGVQSSLSVPLRGPTGPIGSINIYGSKEDAFQGREREIATIFGAEVESVVMNADLSMSSKARAERAAETIEQNDTINIASGVLAERYQTTFDEALSRLESAAERAGTAVHQVAEMIIRCKEDAA